MIQELSLPPLPTWEDVIRHARAGRYESLKRQSDRVVAAYSRRARLATVTGPCTIRLCWGGRGDLDNRAAATKFVLDGLQQAGVLTTDALVKGIWHENGPPSLARQRGPAGVRLVIDPWTGR